MSDKKNPEFVLIEWLDSAQPEPAWRHLDNLPDLDVIHCVSVGWLAGESRGVKMIAPNIGDFDSGTHAQASGFIRIPSAAVTRMVTLVEKG